MVGYENGRITFLQFIQPRNINPPEKNFKCQPHQGPPKPVKHMPNYVKIKTPFIITPFHLHEFALELALICEFCILNALDATKQTSDFIGYFFLVFGAQCAKWHAVSGKISGSDQQNS
jgi:hypothetical protein